MKARLSVFLLFIFSAAWCMGQSYTGSFELIATQHSTAGNMRHDTVVYFFGKEKTAMLIHGRRNQPDMRMVFNPADTTITCLFEMNGRKSG